MEGKVRACVRGWRKPEGQGSRSWARTGSGCLATLTPGGGLCDLGCCVRQVGLEAPVAPGVGARGEWTGSEQGCPEALWSLQPPRSWSSGGKPLPGMRRWPGAGWVSEESLQSSPSDDFLPG